MNKENPILVDMDAILVDMIRRWLELYNLASGENVQLDDVTDYRIDKLVKRPELLSDILYTKGFFISLDPMPGAVEYFTRLLEDGYDMVVVTQVPRESEFGVKEKRDWLKKYFPKFAMANIIFAHRKELVSGAVLFDDKPRHLIEWKKNNPKGLTVTIDYPYNQGVDCSLRLGAENAWEDFYSLLRGV